MAKIQNEEREKRLRKVGWKKKLLSWAAEIKPNPEKQEKENGYGALRLKERQTERVREKERQAGVVQRGREVITWFQFGRREEKEI